MVDILHPAVSLHWEKLMSIPTKSRIILSNYGSLVVLGDTLFIGGQDSKLYVLTLAPISWTSEATPSSFYSLTTFGSRVVIIGGIDVTSNEHTNKLWVREGREKWETSLPPMPTIRACSSAANPTTPECIVVAGGLLSHTVPTDTVEVFIHEKWYTVEPLPMAHHHLQPALHNGNLYLTGGSLMFCCRLNTLISPYIGTKERERHKDHSSWSQVPISLKTPSMYAPPVYDLDKGLPFTATMCSSGQLLVFSYCAVYAYSLCTECWICVGSPMQNSSFKYLAPLPSGELVQMNTDVGRMTLFKGKLKAMTYDPDSHFSVSALYRLESTAIPVVSELVKLPTELGKAVGVSLDDTWLDASDSLKILHQWVSRSRLFVLPPTWRSLLDILRRQGLEELSVQVETYLTNVQSLQERCMSVIMSALLSQWILTPDQLHTALPSYVPTLTKKNIVDCFKRETSLTLPPSLMSSPLRKRTKLSNGI